AAAAPSQGEAVYPEARPTEQRAPRAALGEGGERVRFPRAERPPDPCAAVPRPQPIADLSSHVRCGLERGLQELLVLGRQLQWHHAASETSRRRHGHGVACAGFEIEGLSEKDGLELRLGVVGEYRFQSRLQRLIYARGDEGDGLLQLRTAQVFPERGPWDQRVLQGRRGDDLPYILVLCPRARSGEQRLSAARLGAQGSR